MYRFTITTKKGTSHQFKSKTVTDVALGQLSATTLRKVLKKTNNEHLFDVYYATGRTPASAIFDCSINREWIDGRSKEARKLKWHSIEFYLSTNV